MRHILLFSLFFFTMCLLSQSKASDELKMLHRQYSRKINRDTAAVNSLLKIAKCHIKFMDEKRFPRSKDSSLFYLQKAAAQSSKEGLKIQQGDTDVLLSKFYYDEYDNEKYKGPCRGLGKSS